MSFKFIFKMVLLLIIAAASNSSHAISKNEIVFYTDQTYVSDLKSFWHYYTVFFNHVIDDKHKIGVQLNNANRFNATSNQYQLNGKAIINDYITAVGSVAKAKNNQINYPSLQYLASIYFAADSNIEINLNQGGRIYSMFSNQKIYNYSGYIGYYFNNYFAWFNIDQYSISAIQLYTVSLRKYFGNGESFLTLSANAGRSPDIGDVPPFDQMLIVQQRGAGISGRYFVARSIYIYLGFSYSRLSYSTGLLRKLYDVTAGIFLEF